MIGVRISDETKKRLGAIAAEQQRPLSNLVRLIILEWLEQNDKQPPKKQKPLR